jgi:hypothetical protein
MIHAQKKIAIGLKNLLLVALLLGVPALHTQDTPKVADGGGVKPGTGG